MHPISLCCSLLPLIFSWSDMSSLLTNEKMSNFLFYYFFLVSIFFFFHRVAFLMKKVNVFLPRPPTTEEEEDVFRACDITQMADDCFILIFHFLRDKMQRYIFHHYHRHFYVTQWAPSDRTSFSNISIEEKQAAFFKWCFSWNKTRFNSKPSLFKSRERFFFIIIICCCQELKA